MAYTTIAIIRADSPFKDATNIADAIVTRALEEAESVVDSFIGEVYQLPLASDPPLVRQLATTIAIGLIIEDQNLNLEVSSGIEFNERLQAAFDTLNNIRSRKQKLFDETTKQELALNERVKPQFYPTSASTEAGTTPRRHTMNQQF